MGSDLSGSRFLRAPTMTLPHNHLRSKNVVSYNELIFAVLQNKKGCCSLDVLVANQNISKASRSFIV